MAIFAPVVSMYVLLFQYISKMYFQDYNVVQDCNFKEFLYLKFKIIFAFMTKSEVLVF